MIARQSVCDPSPRADSVHACEGERARIQHLRDRFETLLRQDIPEAVIFGSEAPRLIGTSNFALPGIESATAMIALDLDGVMVSAGSSCSSGKIAASHVLAAMGVEYRLASCALRASFGWNSESGDVDAAIAALTKLWQRKSALGRAALAAVLSRRPWPRRKPRPPRKACSSAMPMTPRATLRTVAPDSSTNSLPLRLSALPTTTLKASAICGPRGNKNPATTIATRSSSSPTNAP